MGPRQSDQGLALDPADVAAQVQAQLAAATGPAQGTDDADVPALPELDAGGDEAGDLELGAGTPAPSGGGRAPVEAVFERVMAAANGDRGAYARLSSRERRVYRQVIADRQAAADAAADAARIEAAAQRSPAADSEWAARMDRLSQLRQENRYAFDEAVDADLNLGEEYAILRRTTRQLGLPEGTPAATVLRVYRANASGSHAGPARTAAPPSAPRSSAAPARGTTPDRNGNRPAPQTLLERVWDELRALPGSDRLTAEELAAFDLAEYAGLDEHQAVAELQADFTEALLAAHQRPRITAATEQAQATDRRARNVQAAARVAAPIPGTAGRGPADDAARLAAYRQRWGAGTLTESDKQWHYDYLNRRGLAPTA